MNFCDTVGELRMFMSYVVTRHDDIPPLEDNDCLCNVDVEATAAANNMNCRRVLMDDDDFVVDYVLTPKET